MDGTTQQRDLNEKDALLRKLMNDHAALQQQFSRQRRFVEQLEKANTELRERCERLEMEELVKKEGHDSSSCGSTDEAVGSEDASATRKTSEQMTTGDLESRFLFGRLELYRRHNTSLAGQVSELQEEVERLKLLLPARGKPGSSSSTTTTTKIGHGTTEDRKHKDPVAGCPDGKTSKGVLNDIAHQRLEIAPPCRPEWDYCRHDLATLRNEQLELRGYCRRVINSSFQDICGLWVNAARRFSKEAEGLMAEARWVRKNSLMTVGSPVEMVDVGVQSD